MLYRAGLAAVLCFLSACSATPNTPAVVGTQGDDCGLGFLAAGSPPVVTRLSIHRGSKRLRTGDVVLAVNDVPASSYQTLERVAQRPESSGQIILDLSRDGRQRAVTLNCLDDRAVAEIRDQALESAADGDWQACIKATYLEEAMWGGPNSQSAELRLQCHNASARLSLAAATSTDRRGAQLRYEHASLLIEELSHVPQQLFAQRGSLMATIHSLEQSGHMGMAEALQQQLNASLIARAETERRKSPRLDG